VAHDSASWTVAFILVMQLTEVAEERRTVCLTVSPALQIATPLKTAVIAEANNIWRPLSVGVGLPEEFDNVCSRPILVKSDLEARPEDGGGETAIAWVPFVAGRARQVIFVRVDRARMLIDAFSPGIRPPGLTDLLLAKLLGRTLAHERSGLIRRALSPARRAARSPVRLYAQRAATRPTLRASGL
jgi:hypothetical protein